MNLFKVGALSYYYHSLFSVSKLQSRININSKAKSTIIITKLKNKWEKYTNKLINKKMKFETTHYSKLTSGM